MALWDIQEAQVNLYWTQIGALDTIHTGIARYDRMRIRTSRFKSLLDRFRTLIKLGTEKEIPWSQLNFLSMIPLINILFILLLPPGLGNS